MIPTLLLRASTPTATAQVPQQSYILMGRGSLGRPQEPERKREGGLWQHQWGRRRSLRNTLPHSVKICTVSRSNKTHLHTQRKSWRAHTQHGDMDAVAGHLFWAFDLLQLSVPLELSSRISASIYVLFHSKTIQLAVIKKGTLQVRVGGSLGE